MSRVLGYHLKRINIQTLEIINPVLDYYDDAKFKALYEAISKSNLKQLTFTPILKRVSRRLRESVEISEFPLYGREGILLSGIETFEWEYCPLNDVSPLLFIVQVLPETLRKLKVI